VFLRASPFGCNGTQICCLVYTSALCCGKGRERNRKEKAIKRKPERNTQIERQGGREIKRARERDRNRQTTKMR
jgi:hypothetical protein